MVSKTLAQNDAVSITIFAFNKNEEVGIHDFKRILWLLFWKEQVGDKQHTVCKGETLIVSAKVPYAVFTKKAFKM